MALHDTVVVPTAVAKSLADIKTGHGTITGAVAGDHIGSDGLVAGSLDFPIMGIVGVASSIDDALFVDPEDGTMGTELIHTMHYPGTNPAYLNEGEVRA